MASHLRGAGPENQIGGVNVTDLMINLMWLGSMIGLGCLVWQLERIEKAIKALR